MSQHSLTDTLVAEKTECEFGKISFPSHEN